MPSAIEIMRARMQQANAESKEENKVEEKVVCEETISEPEIKTVDDVIVNDIKIDKDELIVDDLIQEKEPIKKKRGRPKKQETVAVENITEVQVPDDAADTIKYAKENKEISFEDKIHIEPVLNPTSSFNDCLLQKQSFDFGNMHWTPHKYKIGDIVWVPVDEQVTNMSMYDPIKVVLMKVPKKLTVATVSITNKVCYTFKETSKIIAYENFVCETKEQCEEICKEFN